MVKYGFFLFKINTPYLWKSIGANEKGRTFKGPYTPRRFSASIDVDRCRAVDERCVALLRLVCLGVCRTVVSFRPCRHLPPPIQHVESGGCRLQAVGQINHSDWLFSLANQCMRSETEVRDPNKLLRRQI